MESTSKRTEAPSGRSSSDGGAPGWLHALELLGVGYWSASVLPALLGTTLPFWLRPPDFSFRWLAAAEFLAATVLAHAGFILLLRRVPADLGSGPSAPPRSTGAARGHRPIASGGACLILASLLVLDATRPVPSILAFTYGFSALFAGALYVLPPLRFRQRIGGEIVLAYSLGLIPVLGADLVQVGDLTRTVYVAALPLMATTGLWVWTDELVTRVEDAQNQRRTLVRLLGSRLSGRLVTPAIVAAYHAALAVAVFSGSLAPAALAALLFSGLGVRVVLVSWREHADPERMVPARTASRRLHFASGLTLVASCLFEVLR